MIKEGEDGGVRMEEVGQSWLMIVCVMTDSEAQLAKDREEAESMVKKP